MKLQTLTHAQGWLYVESIRDTPNELSLLCSKDSEDGISADYLELAQNLFPTLSFREAAQTGSV